MKIIYKTILDQIEGAIEHAKAIGKEIRVIILDRNEMYEFQKEIGGGNPKRFINVGHFQGIEIKEE